MKIGEFAKRNQVSIDTIRHYMNLELLLPQKDNKQFDFDSRCQQSIDEIMYLKTLGFSLSDIKNIFLVSQLGRMTPYPQDDYYKDIFKGKLQEIEAGIEALQAQKTSLEAEIHKLDSATNPTRLKMGVSLNWLQMLKCIQCGGSPILKEAAVDNHMVMEGLLTCKCGCEYGIRDGILHVDPDVPNRDQIPDIVSYIRQTDGEYLNQIYKTLEWSLATIDFKDFDHSVLLELGSGSGFFLRSIYDRLPDSTVYIAVDHDAERMRFLKGILEKAENRKNIFFLCCDFTRIPLHDHSIDILCDYTGTSNYSFDQPDFLLKRLEHHFNKASTLLGSYIIFKNFSKDNTIPMECRDNFRLESVRQQLKNLGYSVKADYLSDVMTKGGIYENYFGSNEKVMTYCLIGKRLG